MPIHVDDSRFPLVIIRYVGTTSDDDFMRYLSKMEELVLHRRTTNAAVLDASAADATPAKQRRMQAEWMKSNEALIARYCVGNAFVITSPLLRGALTAIFWMQQPAAPTIVLATFDAAERWATDRLREAGVSVPNRPRAASQ